MRTSLVLTAVFTSKYSTCAGLNWMVRSSAQPGRNVDPGSVEKCVENKRGGTSVAIKLILKTPPPLQPQHALVDLANQGQISSSTLGMGDLIAADKSGTLASS